MKNEKGAATLIEYTIVLPITFAIVFLLITMGFMLHQKSVMESAVQRKAIYISRTISDTNYENIAETNVDVDVNDITGAKIKDIKNDPYRFLFGAFSSGNLTAQEEETSKLIEVNQIFIDTKPEVSVEKKSGLFTTVTVTATQKYEINQFLAGLDIPPIVTIECKSIVYVNQPSEFIRNADFAADIISKVVDSISGVIKETVSKITFFKNKVK